MNRTLVALLAIVAAVAIVALFAWAQDPTRFDNLEIAGTITGTTITASTGFAGDLTGAVTGNVTGDLTGDVTGSASRFVVLKTALPDSAAAIAAGDGHVLLSVTGGTLFIWDASAVTYDAVALAITKDAN